MNTFARKRSKKELFLPEIISTFIQIVKEITIQDQFVHFNFNNSSLMIRRSSFLQSFSPIPTQETFDSIVKDPFGSRYEQKLKQIGYLQEQQNLSVFENLIEGPQQKDHLTSVKRNKECSESGYQSQESFDQNLQNKFRQTPIYILNNGNQKKRFIRDSYPTKNMLVNFKKSHFNFLKQKLGKKFTSNRLIQKLMKKKGISMKQYQKIYTNNQFRQCLENYFNSCQIFRDMMNSKMDAKQKKIYANKIYIFEEAFRSGCFTHIN